MGAKLAESDPVMTGSTSTPVDSEPTTDQTVTATEETVSASTTETPSTESTKVDWWNPETWGETDPKDIIKNIQKEYNSKAERTKITEKEKDRIQQEYNQVLNDVRAAIANPEVYRQYRRQLGYTDEVTTAKAEAPSLDPTKIQTVEDLLGYIKSRDDHWEQRLNQAVSMAKQEAESKIAATTAPIAKERWSTALESMNTKYGEHFANVQATVAQAIADRRYGYNPGSEKELLDKVFRAECPEAYENYILNKKISSVKAKAASATETPRKSTSTPVPKGNSPEDIVKRIQARLGPNTIGIKR